MMLGMTTSCPRDQHGRFLIDRERRLDCDVKGCQCPDCHKVLSEQERMEWVGE